MKTDIYAKKVAFAAGLSFLIAVVALFGQQSALAQEAASPTPRMADSTAIIPGDMVTIHVFEAAELDQVHVRVTDTGEVTLLLAGPVKIGGLTAGEASKVIADIYVSKHFLRNASVAVTVDDTSLAAHAVTVFGYIGGSTSAGAANGLSIPLLAARPLMTVLSMAGGLNDRASHTVTVQRGDQSVKPFKVFLPNDPDQALANQPMIYPGDTIVVPRAGIVYILGDVGQPHGVVMQEDGQISLLQALSQAGSPLPSAGLAKIMIFRKDGGQYEHLPVNVGQMVKGKIPDIPLKSEDVVWVPFSFGKNILMNGTQIIAALGSAATTGIIYSH
jgi:polysaccharide export outer membrane protein